MLCNVFFFCKFFLTFSSNSEKIYVLLCFFSLEFCDYLAELKTNNFKNHGILLEKLKVLLDSN